ncbi:MAG: B12-binding domain-containing radical SAM protein [Planctomycetota bacterium]
MRATLASKRAATFSQYDETIALMDRLLIHPPFADPTQPYLSLPSLKGHLRAHGLDAKVIDLNVEAAHYLLAPPQLDDLARRIGTRFIKLNRKSELSFLEQLEFRELTLARPKIETMLDAHPTPIEVFRDAELFYDGAAYATARRQVDGFFEALSALYFPYAYDFNRAGHVVLPWSYEALASYCEEQRSPLELFYRDVFDEPRDWERAERGELTVYLDDVDFIGISIVFPSQIPEAFYLCKFLRARAPQALIALGGPSIHQSVLHQEEAQRRRLFDYVDAIGLFEGEETLRELWPRLAAWRAAPTAVERHALLDGVPNLLTLDPVTDATRQGPPHILSLREAAAPDYSDLDLDRYLAPSRTLLYAPTRGCYWNKCSFCYYGLSEVATAKYREIPPERAAADLQRMSQRYGTRNFYMSCDVLSPAYAVRLAEALIERGLKLKWSSDLKIDKYFTPERCELLYRSGLRSAAFGIESGSDRILELMRKGCDRATMTNVNRLFHRAGVATEWMTFTDHPGESQEEALATVRWIADESEQVDLFIVGEFGLQPGSHIAHEPQRYGVEKIFFADGDDLRLYAHFTQINGGLAADERAKVDEEVGRVAASYTLSRYPWAGAISTHHTFLHFLRYGQRVFQYHFQKSGAALEGAMPTPATSHIMGLREAARFSLRAIERTEEEFLANFRQTKLRARTRGRRSAEEQEVAPLGLSAFNAAAAAIKPLYAGRQQ